MKLPVTLLLAINLFIHSAVAQQAPAFQVRHYTTENGLPANGIKGMEWDEKTGFLWIATEAGVVRFNGIDFKTFTNKNTPTIGSERFRLLVANNKGIYTADEYENIFRVHQNELALHWKTPMAAKADVYPAYFALSASDTFFNYKVTHPQVKPVFQNFYTPTTIPLTDTSVLFIEEGKPFAITLSDNEPSPLVDEKVFITNVFKIKEQVFLLARDKKIFRLDLASHRLVPAEFDRTFAQEFRNGEFYFFWNGIERNSIVIQNKKAW